MKTLSDFRERLHFRSLHFTGDFHKKTFLLSSKQVYNTNLCLLVAIDYSQFIFVGVAIIALVIAYFLKSKSMYKAPALEV